MIKKIMFILFILVLWWCSSNNQNLNSIKNDQETVNIVSLDNQKKCSDASKEFFNENYKSNEELQWVYYDYNNHYNKKDWSCYILVNIYSNINGEELERNILFDVLENQLIESCNSGNYYLCNKYMIE